MTLIMKSVMMKKMFAIDKVKKKNCIKGIGTFCNQLDFVKNIDIYETFNKFQLE